MTGSDSDTATAAAERPRLRKSDRRREILLELKLRPHVRISELAARFGVSTETVRRDFQGLSEDGLIARAHGGASAPHRGAYPGFDERAEARREERERIGRRAAELVGDGDTVMIDSGSTTMELARALAYRGVQCTVITNSLPIAMTLGGGRAQVMLCPGEYLPDESAVVGAETLEFLAGFHVDHAMIGAYGLTPEGPSESVRGFAAVKRAMLRQSEKAHLLVDGEKFGRRGLARVGAMSGLCSVVVDRRPDNDLLTALRGAEVDILLASGRGRDAKQER